MRELGLENDAWCACGHDQRANHAKREVLLGIATGSGQKWVAVTTSNGVNVLCRWDKENIDDLRDLVAASKKALSMLEEAT